MATATQCKMASLSEITLPCVVLKSSVLKDNLLSASSIPETFAVKSSPQSCIDLNHLQSWHLKWELSSQQQDSFYLTLQCVPNPEFTDKLKSVHLMMGLSVYSSDLSSTKRESRVTVCSVIRLQKQADYLCTLPNDLQPNPLNQSAKAVISLRNFDACISCRVSLFFLGLALDEFSQVHIPPDARCDMGAMLNFDSNEKSKFSDVTLVASPKGDSSPSTSQAPVEFFAHKVILASKSPVFAKMFEHQMQESVNNHVVIDDIDPEVLKEILVYMYTGQTSKIEEMADDLLYMADKYQLDHLKALCEQHLTYSLQVDNASRVTQLAFAHNAPQLRKNALKFIAKNAAEVRATEEWEEVKQGNEILDELIGMMQEPPPKRPKTD